MTNKDSNQTNSSPKMGRPAKYKNEETEQNLQELVYEYKKSHPFSGLIRISHMVRFTERKHREDPETYPIAYSKDVWGSYGKKYIDRANEPIPSALLSELPLDIEVPNLTDITLKYHHNMNKLLEHLNPIEVMLHESLSREQKLRLQVSELTNELSEIKNTVKEQQNTLSLYEKFTLEMAHHSYNDEFQQKYGLINQISINANDRNKKAMSNLNNLESLFPYERDQVTTNTDTPSETSTLTQWRERRKKQKERKE
ncbi:hypothetical protein [Paenibacillus sp. URB8-2]|uniref:hypothetical protein n=1 Tax=Paenibacillus sp. URB8-2 TaxID=2741301 RepID=UPI0015B81A27|nr:hypothetical protein [Paenibacillus sp. URB8-2]BCG60384.1 hypothetical protein PUR_38090 [Paenibacillus sp. URB8-2]